MEEKRKKEKVDSWNSERLGGSQGRGLFRYRAMSRTPSSEQAKRRMKESHANCGLTNGRVKFW